VQFLTIALLLSKAKIFFARFFKANTMPSRVMQNHYFNHPIQILNRLKAVGFTEAQAEAQVKIFTDYVEYGLITKRDLKEVETRI